MSNAFRNHGPAPAQSTTPSTLFERQSTPPRRASLLQVLVAIGVLAAAMPAHAASLQEFGRCLAREGAIFYGASWCPHCRAQRETLGDAMSGVHYVECSINGGRGASAVACDSAHVDSYPTWVFADGSRASGEHSLAELASKTGCPLPSGNGRGAETTIKNPDEPHRPLGPKIIEVPH